MYNMVIALILPTFGLDAICRPKLALLKMAENDNMPEKEFPKKYLIQPLACRRLAVLIS
jgi:hypothetical protein